jgi:glucokinase
VSRRAIGVDIGGTKIAVGAVSENGAIAALTTTPTLPERAFEEGLEAIVSAIGTVLDAAGWSVLDVCGIGIGCAGPLDLVRGTIENQFTLAGWKGCDIVTPLRERFGVPAWLENDADAALVGEVAFGAGRGCENVVMLTFGTGIGSGILVGGRIHRGHAGGHPEMGHVPVVDDGAICYCGRRGCLESVASGTAIAAAGRASAPDVFAARAAGDPGATRIVERALRATAVAAWSILHSFLPERLVLGGGLMEEHYEIFAEPVRLAIAATTLLPAGITVERAQRGSAAGLLGAARIAMERA